MDQGLYTAKATAQGGRDGRVSSKDGKLDLKLSMPKELQGSGGEGTNPEQLFACGYAACYQSALQIVAGKQKVDVSDSKVTANVTIGKDSSNGGFKLAVVLEVSIPGQDQENVQKLADEAHQVCPYSKATRGNIDVEIKAVQ
ncbi:MULTISPECIES: organic hydroperoxide resistance protein [unclassified Fictibacillus]|uniref:organic hydroperoxide resistance protein n=1 Tax=unclassified Fictibacillus TaxID=2644029 RepID=UPI00223D128F|nr:MULTISPECIES: organic hydroperoxide resistance protein [unclassified Fictibacillus]MED2972025.1 organic hydroperoxide resistance protein [Fictibacillus sp. B-59209]UZJ77557.1 organic hydroperoxide resistance protein [Fictibacillus sp. KU28468]